MKIVLALILLVILCSLYLIGGFSYPYDTADIAPTPTPKAYYSISDMAHEASKTLQLYALLPITGTPPVPTPTQQLGASPTPTPPSFTPRPTTATPACTTNFVPQGQCLNGQQPGTLQSLPNNGFCTPKPTSQPCTQPTVQTCTGHPNSTDTCVEANLTCPCPSDPSDGQLDGALVTCTSGHCSSAKTRSGVPIPNCQTNTKLESYCSSLLLLSCGHPPTGTFCYGKPVIYLYPTQPTHVDVAIETTGQIAVSIPQYPQNGWKNVLAHPNGTLEYNGKTYNELFYETSVSDFSRPTRGIVIKTRELKKDLTRIITQLGLTKENEQQEFLEWWLPRLHALQTPYILFSVLDTTEKQKSDKVTISPQPDTFIEFIAYFKPLKKPITVPMLHLPQTPPQRIGFTAIEWGGVIDN